MGFNVIPAQFIKKYFRTTNSLLLKTYIDLCIKSHGFSWVSVRYLHAVANPGLISLTGPYLDVGGAGYVVTISHTIHSSR